MSAYMEYDEGSTAFFDIVVRDVDGDPVVPTACTYTVLNRDKEVINTQEDVAVTPALSMRINLSGDDLLIEDATSKREYRTLTVESDQGDVNLPDNQEIEFWVKNLNGVTT